MDCSVPGKLASFSTQRICNGTGIREPSAPPRLLMPPSILRIQSKVRTEYMPARFGWAALGATPFESWIISVFPWSRYPMTRS